MSTTTTLNDIPLGQKFKLANGTARTYTKHRNSGNPIPQPDGLGGYVYKSSATIRNSKGLTMYILLTTPVIPIS